MTRHPVDAISLNELARKQRLRPGLSRSPSPTFFPLSKSMSVRSRAKPMGNGTAPHANGKLPEIDELEGKHASSPLKAAVIDWEVPRKVLHSSIGFIVIPLYVSGAQSTTVVKILTSMLAVIVPADLLRFRSRRFARLYEALLGFLMRDSEKEKINGVIWYLVGATAVLVAYPVDIAVASILALSWCDTAASTFGRAFGPRTPPLPPAIPLVPPFFPERLRLRLRVPLAVRKSTAGFVAAATTGGLIVFGFWSWLAPAGCASPAFGWQAGIDGSLQPTGSTELAGVAVVSGIAIGVLEALDLGSLDDNFTLPILTGAFFFFLSKLTSLI